MMQKEFQPLLSELAVLLPVQFGDRLVSGYLHGSILYGDAIPGVSDLDYVVILAEPSEADRRWLQALSQSLEGRYPAAAQVHLTPVSPEDLRSRAFLRFALAHNAALHLGQDALALLAALGIAVPAADAAFAQGRLAFARHCFQQALRGETPDCTGPLPDESPFRLRKFARYFVVIEGAYCLMSLGRFRSFRPGEVLAGLDEAFPEHLGLLSLTRTILSDPHQHDLLPDEYLRQLEPLMQDMFHAIEIA